MTPVAAERHRLRIAGSTVALLLLLLPAASSLAPARLNISRAGRLRTLHRAAPDTGLDQYYRRLMLSLPERGRIGFSYPNPRNTEDFWRILFFLQYSLAPRRLVQSQAEPFVLAIERPGAPSLTDDPAFELVNDMGDGIRVFRRAR